MQAQAENSDFSDEDIVGVFNASGAGNFVLACEHAANYIPAEFNNLGLSDTALTNHIAWDPGAREVARAMALRLDAPLVEQHVSRLLYDCNRPPAAPSAVSVESETQKIPGNIGLSEQDRQLRIDRFYEPFRATLTACLDQRRDPVIVTVHSFTPVFLGVKRLVDIGILHDADTRFADQMLKVTEAEKALVVARNDPYGPDDGVTHTLVEHGLSRQLLNVMLEIRHDLIDDAASQQSMAERLSQWLVAALAQCEPAATFGSV
ncbi:MAG: N-formylglutamate amidohydrolase, partial [Hyphomicrobiales bacterium]